MMLSAAPNLVSPEASLVIIASAFSTDRSTIVELMTISDFSEIDLAMEIILIPFLNKIIIKL